MALPGFLAARPLCYNHPFGLGIRIAATVATMDSSNLPDWLQAVVALSGGLGLFVVAFLDSTFVPFPTLNDLLLIAFSIRSPARMPFYAAMTTLGSLVGCLVLFSIARKGGELAFGSRAGPHAAGVRHWIERNGFLSVAVASLLPPPAPFKVFVIAAGALGMPLRVFVLSLALARSVRFFGEGFLAVHYGSQAAAYLADHKLALTAASIVFAAAVYLLWRWFANRAPQQAS
jgi:membrane protein YqaA with SNARE-associated domain